MGGALTGWTVVVTRAEGPEGPLGAALAAQGAKVLHVPTVSIGPPDDPGPLRRALHRLDSFQWMVLTSPRAVRAVSQGLAEEAGPSTPAPRLPARLKVAVVGAATADHARAAGIEPELVGSGDGGEALAHDLVEEGVGPGSDVLFPASNRAGSGLAAVLRKTGARVEQVVAYETRIRAVHIEAHPAAQKADAVTFTSPSAVEGWVSAWARDGVNFPVPPIPNIAIGATTAAALEKEGLGAMVAPEPSLDGVVDAVARLARESDEPT